MKGKVPTLETGIQRHPDGRLRGIVYGYGLPPERKWFPAGTSPTIVRHWRAETDRARAKAAPAAAIADAT